jgi:hypothetical protein
MMQGSVRWFEHSMVMVLADFLAGTAMLGHTHPAAADFQFTQLEGLQEAITRHYASDEAGDGYISIEIFASKARFDTEAHAEAAYAEVTWHYANGSAPYEPGATPKASPVTDLGDATTASTSVTHTEMLVEWDLEHTILVTRDAELLYVVSAIFQREQEPQALETTELARSLVASMLATDAGEDAIVEGANGTLTGGLWETLPPIDHEALQPYALG